MLKNKPLSELKLLGGKPTISLINVFGPVNPDYWPQTHVNTQATAYFMNYNYVVYFYGTSLTLL